MKKVDLIFVKPHKSKDFFRCLLSISFIAVFLLLYIQGQAQFDRKDKWTYNDPFNTNVFIENFGQFDNWTTGAGKIEYALNKSEKIFFSKQGLTFRVDKLVRKEKFETEENDLSKGTAAINKNNKTAHDKHPIGVRFAVHMNWVGCNPDPEIVVTEPTSNYFTFGEKGYENIKAKGYKTLLYKDIYSGIDVEYTIPDKGGIKYKIIVHPGADVTKIKMNYSGDILAMKTDENGNVIISTPAGDIVDHAPVTYYESDRNSIPSSFIIKDYTVKFSFPSGYSTTQTLIIDPWTVTPIGLSTDNTPFDCAYDDAGNIYVSGGTVPRKLSKYSSNGVLLWTYTYPANWGDFTFGYYGRFCVLPNSGSTIIGEGFNLSGPRVMKITPSGTLFYTTFNLANTEEIWVMFYNRCTGKLVGFGGGTGGSNNMQIIADTNLSSSTAGNFNGNAGTQNDVAAAEEDYNGDFYALMSSEMVSGDNGWLMKSLSSSNYTSTVWEVDAEVNSAEAQNYGIPAFNTLDGVTVRANELALNENFLFSYDGKNLKAWNKASGALLGSTIVNATYADGKFRTHEGIAVDDCNNVYVGGTNMVHAFSFDGSAFTAAGTIPMSNEVYDVRLEKISGTLYACGIGFLTSTPASIYCAISQLTLNTTVTPGVCNGSASTTVIGGISPYTYIWSNGSTTYDISGVAEGWYSVTVNDNSCIQLRGVDSVYIATSFPISVSNDTTICSGNPVPLLATGGTAYTWSPAGSLSNSNIANPLASPTFTTTYSVIISNGGCIKTDSVIVTVNPAFSTNNPQTICSGQTYFFNSHYYSTTGIYYDTLTSNTGCDSIIITLLTMSPPPITNNPQTICSGQTYYFNTHIYSVAGTYYDTLTTLTGCDSVIVTQLTVYPVTTTNNPQTICSGQTYTFNAHIYAATGIYYDTLTSSTGCDSIILTLLTVSPPLFTNNPQTICSGQVYTFNMHIYSSTGTYYDTLTTYTGCDSIIVTQLTVNPASIINNPQTICNGQSYTFNGHIYSVGGTYYDTLTTVSGCDSVIITLLTVMPLPVITILPGNDTICSGESITLTASGAATYTWSNGLGNTNPLASSPNATTTYTVTGTASGCTSTASVVVTVVQSPIAAFTVDPLLSYIETDFVFSNHSSNATTYFWNFNDGNTSNEYNPVHCYQLPGTYLIWLYAQNSIDCTDSTSQEVEVITDETFYMPSAFTPDGNGINDLFGPQGVGLNNYLFEIYIFDRWGKLIFKTDKINEQWNGKYLNTGKLCPQDVYTWVVFLKNKGSVNYKSRFLGTVTLL